MKTLQEIFNTPKPVIAMIHLPALPGAPAYSGNWEQVVYQSLSDAEAYREAGVDAVMIENMHDVPYLKGKVGPEVSASMAVLGHSIKQATALPVGVQVLAGANQAAVAVAKAAGLDFIRTEGFVFAHVADEGLIESDAGTLLRYRKAIDADHIPIFTDIKKKHSAHAITQDVDIAETAQAATFFLSDGLIVTGLHTGQPANLDDLARVREATPLPVFVGSGITLENAAAYLQYADGLIIGSYFKKEGYWGNPVDGQRVRRFMKMMREWLQ